MEKIHVFIIGPHSNIPSFLNHSSFNLIDKRTNIRSALDLSTIDKINKEKHNLQSLLVEAEGLSGLIGSPASSDTLEYLYTLHLASILHPKDNFIIVRDDSITNVQSENIIKIINNNLKLKDFDVLFLCKWDDQCQMYTEKVDLESGGFTVKTQYPGGLQAIYFTPVGRDIILGRHPMSDGRTFFISQSLSDQIRTEIKKGRINARAIVPNIIGFDIRSATNNNDFLKLNECRQVTQSDNTNSSTSTYLWFFLIVLIIIIMAWCMIRLGPYY